MTGSGRHGEIRFCVLGMVEVVLLGFEGKLANDTTTALNCPSSRFSHLQANCVAVEARLFLAEITLHEHSVACCTVILIIDTPTLFTSGKKTRTRAFDVKWYMLLFDRSSLFSIKLGSELLVNSTQTSISGYLRMRWSR